MGPRSTTPGLQLSFSRFVNMSARGRHGPSHLSAIDIVYMRTYERRRLLTSRCSRTATHNHSNVASETVTVPTLSSAQPLPWISRPVRLELSARRMEAVKVECLSPLWRAGWVVNRLAESRSENLSTMATQFIFHENAAGTSGLENALIGFNCESRRARVRNIWCFSLRS